MAHINICSGNLALDSPSMSEVDHGQTSDHEHFGVDDTVMGVRFSDQAQREEGRLT